MAGLKAPAKEVSRDRVLSEDEIRAYWTAAESEGYPFAQFAHVLLLTAQRRGEVAGINSVTSCRTTISSKAEQRQTDPANR